MRIQNNIMAVNTHRQLGISNTALGKSAEKLSSGFRVNRAGDDAAGLAISEKMRGQISGLKMASKNSLDAISMVQTAEGSLQEVHSMLQRMRELAVQSASDSNQNTVDREALQSEFSQLQEEIDDIANKGSFNKQVLLDGTFKNKVIQVGPNAADTMDISISSMSTTGLSLTKTAVSIGTRTAASAAISAVDAATNTVSSMRAVLGAKQNRLEHKINNLDTTAENVQAAESRIRDTDMAKEMSTFTIKNVQQQAAIAMLAQANASPQAVLSLLG